MYLRVLASSRIHFEKACRYWNINQYVDAKYVMDINGLRGNFTAIIILPQWQKNNNIDVYVISQYLSYAVEEDIQIYTLNDNEQLPEQIRNL